MKKYNNKLRDNVTPIEKENERDENYSPDNPQIDLSRTHNNYHIIYPQSSYMEYINERICTLPMKRKVRSDAVLMCSFIIGSDGNFFIGLTPWERQRFFVDATEYFAERYGKENIISAVVHTDETTPHLHLNLIPIVGNKLSAKQLFTRASLRELQTDFHDKVGKKWNLERGKEGSQAKHIDTAEFKAKTIIEHANKEAEEYLSRIESSIEAERSKPVPKKKKSYRYWNTKFARRERGVQRTYRYQEQRCGLFVWAVATRGATRQGERYGFQDGVGYDECIPRRVWGAFEENAGKEESTYFLYRKPQHKQQRQQVNNSLGL